MVKVFPFRGILYNKKKLKKIDKLFSPPYDVISEEEQDALYQQHELNIIRIILGKSFPGDGEFNNKYVRSAAFLDGWLRHEIMLQDKKPAFYLYEQRFRCGGKKHARLGFIGLLRLEDMGHGKVYPHEETYSRAKLDRLELMRATSSNLESIFSLYNDEKQKVTKVLKKFKKSTPFIEVKDKKNTIHRIWKIDSKPAIQKITKEMKDKAVFIADGHHRYEAAQRFKDELKAKNTRFSEDEAYNHVMMYFNSIEDEGLIILPIHRVLHNLPYFDAVRFEGEIEPYFNVTPYPANKKNAPQVLKKLLGEMHKISQDKHAFGLYLGKYRYYLLTLKDESFVEEMVEEEKPKAWKNLDVTVLHYAIFDRVMGIADQTGEKVLYTSDAEEAIKMVDEKNCQAAILLNPTKIEEIIAIASKLEKMPHKSTFFYPKLLSGLVLNKISHGEKIKL